jgi:Rrf2 family protein
MKFGVGIDYSLKALIMLAERLPSAQPLRVEEIAATQGIPENYLRRLLIELKRGGLVLSQKGPSGGYMLARQPAKITMADVVQTIEGDYVPVECLEDGANSPCRKDDTCAMRAVWRDVRDAVVGILTATTLQALAERRKSVINFQIQTWSRQRISPTRSLFAIYRDSTARDGGIPKAVGNGICYAHATAGLRLKSCDGCTLITINNGVYYAHLTVGLRL